MLVQVNTYNNNYNYLPLFPAMVNDYDEHVPLPII
jgi:hypothetical protein